MRKVGFVLVLIIVFAMGIVSHDLLVGPTEAFDKCAYFKTYGLKITRTGISDAGYGNCKISYDVTIERPYTPEVKQRIVKDAGTTGTGFWIIVR